MSKIFEGVDGYPRCSWCSATPDYIAYHDHEWGFPVNNDKLLFEKISLEGFQSGLILILIKLLSSQKKTLSVC